MKFTYFLVLLPSATTAASSFQSGPLDGAVYAAGMVMDEQNVYLTGITYDTNINSQKVDGKVLAAPDCFVASLTENEAALQFNLLNTYGVSETIAQTCRGIAVLSDQQLVVVGTSEPGGLFAEETSLAQVGFGMTVGRDDLELIAGSSLFTDTLVPYPQAIVVDPSDSDSLYVASMTANDNTVATPTDEFPNWTHLFEHGTNFEMTIEKLQYTRAGAGSAIDGLLGGDSAATTQPKITTAWSHQFPVEKSADGSTKSVYVGGMIYKQDVGLIVAGSTAALGIGYGPAEGDDQDGYISILDPSSGELKSGVSNNQRFGTEFDDVVTSICDDPNDPSSFYIVGATKGDLGAVNTWDTVPVLGSLQAFIMKVNVDSLISVWKVQHGAYNPTKDGATIMSPWGCVVKDDVVYMAGEVMDGAGIIDESDYHTSQGGDDIFIVQYNKEDGVANWIQQVGSAGNDHMARGGGVRIDPTGDAVVFGDTTGSLYRERTVGAAADIFVISFAAADGAFTTTLEGDSPGQIDTILEATMDPSDSTGTLDPKGDGVEVEVGNDFGWVDPGDLKEGAIAPPSAQAHQSGPNPGALFASGFIYDPDSDQALIAGISYTDAEGEQTEEPGCLVARIEVGSMETKAYNILGDQSVLEACRGIGMAPGGDLFTSSIVIVGNSEAGGMYFGNNQDIQQTGFGMTLSGNDLSAQQGGNLFSNSIPYPQAVQVDGNTIYVASMTSNDLRQNSNNPISTDFPNWTYLNKYGKAFTMTLEKLTLPNFESVWSQTYAVQPESDGSVYSVHVGGLILKRRSGGDVLVVVGSTRAKGAAYGSAKGDDADGYISLIDPSTGELLSNAANNARIGSPGDDVLSQVCDVPSDESSVIVVGATKGDVGGIKNDDDWNRIPDDSLMWFAKKINLDTFEETWTIQGGAIVPGQASATSSYAVACSVLGDNVYVGGTVENGASLLENGVKKDSMGGNDVWVAKLNLADGTTDWIKQFGSVGDDQLARHGGLAVNKDGDAIVFGDTTGAIYRDRVVASNADIFLAVLLASSGNFGTKGTSAPGSGPEADIPEAQPTPAPETPEIYQKDVDAAGENIPDNIIALQIGPDVGPSYAGGMDYDPSSNSLYLTGATYGAFSGPGVVPAKTSSCFFSRIDLPNLDVMQRDKYGSSSHHDGCTAIAANPFNGQRNAIVIGATEYGGLLTELAERGSQQHGFAIDLVFQHKFEFVGGAIVGNHPVTYPVALVADEENFWTLSMVSENTKINPDYSKVKRDEYPNFTNGGVDKYGKSYSMSIESFKYIRSGDGDPFAQGAAKNFDSEWSVTHPIGDNEGMLVSGMISVGDFLLVVGTVRNEGILDGFITKVKREDGSVDESGQNGTSIQYVEANDESDSWVMNACVDEKDSDYFYIVGATQSVWDGNKKLPRNPNKRPVHAFAAKIKLTELSLEWLVRLEIDDRKGQTAAAAYGCDVFSTEHLLYVVGTVEDGARMSDAQSSPGVPGLSAGGDDIFVAQISTLNGQLRWLRQTGSNGDDRVARGGGIKADNNGNAIVFGDTTGDFFRIRNNGADKKERNSDLFVMLFDKHYGVHQPPLNGPKIKSNGGPSEFFNKYTKNPKTPWQIFGYVVLSFVLLGLVYVVYRRYCRRSRKEPVSIYDASADLSYHGDSTTKSSGFGLGLFRDDDKVSLTAGNNLNYRDDDIGDFNGGSLKPFSDLPRNGKEII